MAATLAFGPALRAREGALVAQRYTYSEDFFADTRMSFGDHLEDLRSHLLRAFKWFLIGMVAAFFIGDKVVVFISEPVKDALEDYHIKYYKKHAAEENKLLQKFAREIENEKAKGDKGDPRIVALGQPQAIQLQFNKRELLDKLGVKVNGGGNPPGPGEEEDIVVAAKLRPEEFAHTFQAPMTILAKRTVLTSLSAQETFMVYFKVCVITGFVISSPLVFYHVWSFIAAGLYPHEKRLVNVYLPFSLFLFLGGVAICQFAIIPAALQALLGFNLWLNVEPDFRLNEWLGFAIWMPVITGLCFQTPLVMFMLGKLGVMTPEGFRSKRKICIFVMLIVAAVLSPSVDPGSLMLMWLPMVLLYELGIWMVKWTVQPPMEEMEVPYQPGMEAGVSTNGEAYRESPRD